MTDRTGFESDYDFPFDRFQIDAFDHIDEGFNVVVAAPTGSGKTIVAEYGIWRALSAGRRVFYTAPVKALSNQKYRDFCERYGVDRVGLLTGDNAINPDASIVVMTTEVLRNMIYAEAAMSDLATVVVDEVHFLQDTYRGPVWEEVIIQLPDHVRLICLSATVSNSGELADWIATVRGPSSSVVEQTRPVPLDNLFLVEDKSKGTLRSFSTLQGGSANPSALRLDSLADRSRNPTRRQQRNDGRNRRILAAPSRFEVVDFLRTSDLLPAAYFIFSRRQCSEAATALARSGLRLTKRSVGQAAVELARARVAHMNEADLAVLGFDSFLDQLAVGVAAHHAGMVPAFKEIVEECFQAGTVRLVFATETLAVGVNMPARSVVIEKLTKYNGERHEMLSPAQFTQLCGRAGRRGMDQAGTAVTLWSPFVRFDQVAELVSTTAFTLRSAFRPTYNMSAHLVDRYDQQHAEQFLGLSFAQFQADRHVVALEREVQRLQSRLADELEQARSPFGDIDAFAHKFTDGTDASPIETALVRLRPGDLIEIDAGTFKGPGAVVASSTRKGGVKLSAITAGGSLVHLRAHDFDTIPLAIGAVVLPGAFSPNQRTYRAEVAKRIKSATLGVRKASSTSTDSDVDQPETPDPILEDPQLGGRLAALDASRHTRDQIKKLQRRVRRRDAALTRAFDRVLDVMEALDFFDRSKWQLTDAGSLLKGIFHENDLLICQVLTAGLLDGLDEPTLAATLSVFVYEHRSPEEPPDPWFPNDDSAERWARIVALSVRQSRIERGCDRPEHRMPDPTLFGAVHGWVSGVDLANVLDDDVTGGDFVRNLRQVVDLLEQVGTVAPSPQTRATARRAARAAYRDIVAADPSDQAQPNESASVAVPADGQSEHTAAQP